MRLRSPRKSTSEVRGQSCRALPVTLSGGFGPTTDRTGRRLGAALFLALDDDPQRRTYALRRGDSNYVVFCFAHRGHADAFCKRFEGKRLPETRR
jgi:hypothetical protein